MASEKTSAARKGQLKTKAEVQRLFALQTARAPLMAATTVRQRRERLRRLLKQIHQYRPQIKAALHADFRKPAVEVDLTEVLVTTTELKHALYHLRRWMRPQRVKPILLLATTRARVHFRPKGVVLIISPWNYPFMLAIGPLISAIAAGNCVMLKPSELAPHTSRLLKEMLSEIFPEEEVAVIEGDKSTAEVLLQQPFNHIFFTGSSTVGKLVMKAAAENLTSVTLELGGKSPAIVDESANLADAARKLCWGKFSNTGQTCVAPDYLLVQEKVSKKLISLLKEEIECAYGRESAGRQANPDFGRVIDENHCRRLQKLIEESVSQGAKIEIGGEVEVADRYVAPTILSGVPENAPLMQQEIFGPVLPVMTYKTVEEVLGIVARQPTPLALYLFSRRRKNIRRVLSETVSGGCCVNDLAVQFSHPNLPFGGLNHSGIGNSHGFAGFRAFSHERPVLKHNRFSPLKLLFPPYTRWVEKLTDWTVRYL